MSSNTEYCAYCGTPLPAVSSAPCPQCGNPSNGAPRAAAVPGVAPSRTGPGVIVIIILLLLGGVVVIGILAAIAIPNFLTAKERAMQKRTMADMRSLASAAEAYASDNNEYPRSPEALAPKYMKARPINDGWGHAFDYDCVAEDAGRCTSYAIRSRGKDGVAEHPLLREAIPDQNRATTNFDCDIIYTNGTFMEYPEGAQTH